jgi:glycosyltransferase involved in cell wall biosynthesis
MRPPGWKRPKDFELDGAQFVDHCTVPTESEIAVVHLGNNPYHEWLLPHLERGDTVAVVHDLILHHLLIESTVAHGRVLEYSRRISAAHGRFGAALGDARRFGLWAPLDPFLASARSAFLGRCRGLVVHSDLGERLVRSEFSDIPVLRTALAVADPGPVDREVERSALGIDPATLVVMHLGFLTPAKGLREVLGAVASAVAAGADVRLVMVGEGQMMDALTSSLRELHLDDRVTTTGWVSPERLRRIPAAADIGVVLRTPSAGETSAAALRFLACGTPVAVSAQRQFLELPRDAVVRVTPGPSASADLARALVDWRVGSDRAARMRRAARGVYEANGHRPAEAATSFLRWLSELRATAPCGS